MRDDFSYNAALGIPRDMEGVYLHTVEPRNEDQRRLKGLLEGLKEREYRTLLLLGDTGLGKTYMAQALANTFIHNANSPEWAAFYTTHFELDLRLKNTMDAGYKGVGELELINRYKSYGLLIIDELGRGAVSDYAMTRIEHIVCERIAKGRRTILISNKTPDELRGIFDRQMQDRLGILKGGVVNSSARCFVMSGPSLRGRT